MVTATPSAEGERRRIVARFRATNNGCWGCGLVSAEAPNKHTDYHQDSADVQNGWNARSLSFSNSLPKEDSTRRRSSSTPTPTAGVFILRIDGEEVSRQEIKSRCPRTSQSRATMARDRFRLRLLGRVATMASAGAAAKKVEEEEAPPPPTDWRPSTTAELKDAWLVAAPSERRQARGGGGGGSGGGARPRAARPPRRGGAPEAAAEPVLGRVFGGDGGSLLVLPAADGHLPSRGRRCRRADFKKGTRCARSSRRSRGKIPAGSVVEIIQVRWARGLDAVPGQVRVRRRPDAQHVVHAGAGGARRESRDHQRRADRGGRRR